jgi:predicted nucleotidyltransferase
MDIKKWLEDSIIFECISGSHAYGLNTPESDEDLRGVCIPPYDYTLGLFEFSQAEEKSPRDRTIYSIVKFVKLAIENNPNILELLFMPEDCIIKTSSYWTDLTWIREQFLSKKCKHTYSRYAYSQIKRVKTHREWLLKPPDHKPTRQEFNLPEHQKMSADYMGAIESIIRSETGAKQEELEKAETVITVETDFIPADIMRLYEKERAYRNAKMKWEQYQNWKATRNPKRAELEAKYGYDSKHLGHTFRLLVQGEEILSKGTLSVRLSPENIEFIQSIKNGVYPYDELMEMADNRVIGLDKLYETTTLRNSADKKKISDVMVGIILDFYVGEVSVDFFDD